MGDEIQPDGQMSKDEYIYLLEQRVRTLEDSEDRLDLSNIGEDDYIGANITGLGKRQETAAIKTSFVTPGTGPALARLWQTMKMLLPYTEGPLEQLYRTLETTSAEDGKAVAALNTTLTGKASMKYKRPSLEDMLKEMEEETEEAR